MYILIVHFVHVSIFYNNICIFNNNSMYVLLVHCIYNYYHELNSDNLTFVIA